MWYRLGQAEEIKSKEVTDNDIKAAKVLLEAARSLENLDDDKIKKALEDSKAGFVKLKDLSKILYNIGDAIPFLEPQLAQQASDINDAAEQFIAATVSANFVKESALEKADLQKITQMAGEIPTDLNSAVKIVKKLELKNVVYLANLYGDFFVLTGNPAATHPLTQLAFVAIKWTDYRLTWFPKLEADTKIFQEAKRKYDSAKNKAEKDQAWESMQQSVSGILGVISSLLIDIGTIVRPLGVLLPPILTISTSLIGIGVILQGASSLLDVKSPVYYRNIPAIPGEINEFATGLANMYYGQPFNANSGPTEKNYPIVTKKTPDKDSRKDPAKKEVNKFEVLMGLLKPGTESEIYLNLDTNFKSYNKESWINKYNSGKTDELHQQPSFVIIEYAKDVYGKKYPWLDMPNTTQYKNFVKYLAAQKAIMRDPGNQKNPSNRSIAAALIKRALENDMSYNFTAPLIKEMANKYNAGNIYNFLNKKNVEINNLISNEARNANFAERFNVRPGSAGLDLLKVDIMNLKKILNTGK
jgi:hypothetical protein